MAWTTPGTATAGEVLTAAFWNANVRDNSIMGSPVYTDEAARDAAITAPVEGMQVYLTAPTVPAATGATSTAVPTGIKTIYNGSVWVCVTPVGGFSSGNSQALTTAYADLSTSATLTSATLVTGTTANVSFGGRIAGNGNFIVLSVKTGTVASSDGWGCFNQSATFVTVGRSFVITGLTAGTNTFTLQGKSNVGGSQIDHMTIMVSGIA
jgi:hypothetical protein